MTEMIDRCVDSVRSTVEFGSFWDENDARAIVKAVIQAMREPSEAMADMGADLLDVGAEVETVWQAMIDEILSPGKSGMGEG